MNRGALWIRAAGVCVLIACLVAYVPGAEGIAQRLLLPLLMAAGAWALTGNLTAVAVGGTLLAAIHSDLSSVSWIDRIAYPLLTTGGVLLLAVILTGRFRARILATHEARWSARASDKNIGTESGRDRSPLDE